MTCVSANNSKLSRYLIHNVFLYRSHLSLTKQTENYIKLYQTEECKIQLSVSNHVILLHVQKGDMLDRTFSYLKRKWFQE